MDDDCTLVTVYSVVVYIVTDDDGDDDDDDDDKMTTKKINVARPHIRPNCHKLLIQLVRLKIL